jgi:two-component system phosphate regulon sensor histidine kinase PhoR
MPFGRHLLANIVALAPSAIALLVLWWFGHLAGPAALLAFCGIAVVTAFLVQRYLGALARFARFVGELNGESEPAMPRLAFAPAAEELATAAATLAAGWRRQQSAIGNLAASAQAVVDGLPDALIAVDRQRRIVRTNRAARSLLGSLTADRDLSTALRQPQLLAAIDELLQTGADGNFTDSDSRSVEFVLQGAPDRDLVAHVRRLPRAAADGSLALVVLHDTTALKRAERMRADFVANASHELKTPIAGLAGFIETLRGPAREDAAARERFLSIMAEQADRMRRLVDDLLMLSRIEQHEHSRPEGRVDLGRVLKGVQDLLQLKAQSRGVRLELDIAAGL